MPSIPTPRRHMTPRLFQDWWFDNEHLLLDTRPLLVAPGDSVTVLFKEDHSTAVILIVEDPAFPQVPGRHEGALAQ